MDKPTIAVDIGSARRSTREKPERALTGDLSNLLVDLAAIAVFDIIMFLLALRAIKKAKIV